MVVWVRQPWPCRPLVPCGLLTWPREAGTSKREGLWISGWLVLLPRAPDGSAWLEPKPASQRAAPSRDVWETPLTNGFVQRPGGLWTQPQGSSLATSLGPRMQGHLAGSEPAPGPDIPAWRPRGPPPCAAAAHLCQPEPSGALVRLGWEGAGLPRWQPGNVCENQKKYHHLLRGSEALSGHLQALSVWAADGALIELCPVQPGWQWLRRPSQMFPCKLALRKRSRTEHFPTARAQCAVPCQGSLLPSSTFLWLEVGLEPCQNLSAKPPPLIIIRMCLINI